MPLYDYACTKCGRVHEIRHGFDEVCDRSCEACGAPLRRVFNPAPVLFKGSGFYSTDSRRSSGAKAEKSEKPKEEAGGGKTDTAPKGEPKGGSKGAESAA